MCGIAGFWDPRGGAPDALAARAGAMADAMPHRGPDDRGSWADAAGVAFGHRRLSIIDLSAAGHQPMHSPAGRHVLTFNGEIYNFAELRRDLPDTAWRGHADTEVLLAACDRWGVEQAVTRAVGMFAFAVWDRAARVLHLVRDRMGEKPLYWTLQGGVLLFGSELRALQAHPAFQADLAPDAVADLMRYGTVAGGRAIFEGVQQVRPGTVLTFTADPREAPRESIYWSVEDIARAGQAHPLAGSDDELLDQLEAVLGRAIVRQTVADVPVGAFLSGGVDSSLVVALLRQGTSGPVRTFTIGFSDDQFDESGAARAVAEHLETRHTTMMVSGEDALAVVPTLADIYDEPFADASQIPTALVARLTRQHVTVALSGDGGDELFAGYDRYRWARLIERRTGWWPGMVRPVAAGALRMLAGIGNLRTRERRRRMADLARSASRDRRYALLLSAWPSVEDVVPRGLPTRTTLATDVGWLEAMMLRDQQYYLPDDILTKVDRAAMAVALEARVPFLDPEVVTFAWRLPRRMRWREGQGKWALRALVHRHVPPSLMDRPKQGFGVPLDAWLRGPLQEWAGDLLALNALRSDGLFETKPVTAVWDAHRRGRRNAGYLLWPILMFQAWRARYLPRRS